MSDGMAAAVTIVAGIVTGVVTWVIGPVAFGAFIGGVAVTGTGAYFVSQA